MIFPIIIFYLFYIVSRLFSINLSYLLLQLVCIKPKSYVLSLFIITETIMCQYCLCNINKVTEEILKHTKSCEYPRQDVSFNHICFSCDYHTYMSESMRRHIRKHLGEKPFVCQYCLLTFSRKDRLNSHIKVKHHVFKSSLSGISIVKKWVHYLSLFPFCYSMLNKEGSVCNKLVHDWIEYLSQNTLESIKIGAYFFFKFFFSFPFFFLIKRLLCCLSGSVFSFVRSLSWKKN